MIGERKTHMKSGKRAENWVWSIFKCDEVRKIIKSLVVAATGPNDDYITPAYCHKQPIDTWMEEQWCDAIGDDAALMVDVDATIVVDAEEERKQEKEWGKFNWSYTCEMHDVREKERLKKSQEDVRKPQKPVKCRPDHKK